MAAPEGDFDFFDCHLKKLHMAPSFVNPDGGNAAGIWNQQIQRNTSEASTRASAGSDNTPTGSREASRAAEHTTPPSYAAMNTASAAPTVVHNPMPVPAAGRPQSPKSRPVAAPAQPHQGAQEVWVAYKTAEGREYYHCKANGQTVWEVPPGSRVVQHSQSQQQVQHQQQAQQHHTPAQQQHAPAQQQQQVPAQQQHGTAQHHAQEQYQHMPAHDFSQVARPGPRHVSQEQSPMASGKGNMLTQKAVQEGVCARCSQLSQSHFDHVCPCCGTIICIGCLEDLRLILDHWRCPQCGNEEESRSSLRAELWAIGTYRSATRLFGAIRTSLTGAPAPQASPVPLPSPVASNVPAWGPASSGKAVATPSHAHPATTSQPVASQRDGYPAQAGMAHAPNAYHPAPDAESFVKIIGTGNLQSSSSYQPHGASSAVPHQAHGTAAAAQHQAPQTQSSVEPERTTRPPVQWPAGWAEAATSLFGVGGGNASSQASGRSAAPAEEGIRWAGVSQNQGVSSAAHQTRPPANWGHR